jgi:hypothetical protein
VEPRKEEEEEELSMEIKRVNIKDVISHGLNC